MTKLKVVENCRATGMKIVLVPTIVKGLNDHQIGDIVHVAIDNIDTVSGISFQLVAFTGCIPARAACPALHTGGPRALCGRADGHHQVTRRLVPAGQRHAVLEAHSGHSRHRRRDHLVASALLVGHIFLR